MKVVRDTDLLRLKRTLAVRSIEAKCPSCGPRSFHSLRANSDSITKGSFYCVSCGREESFLLQSMRSNEAKMEIDLAPMWDKFHSRLKHYTLRAAKDPEQLITTRCVEVMHEASVICGRGDVGDFTLSDLKHVVDYIYQIAERAKVNRWNANDVLTIKGVLDDYSTIRPLVYQAQLVATALSPMSMLAKLLGTAAIGSMMFIPSRAKRAGTVYAFGHLSFLLMSPK